MKLEVPTDFLAPSLLDYGAYCRTAERGGFAVDDQLSQAMACFQEAREWRKNGNFEIVTPDSLIRYESEDVWMVSTNKASLKYAIHSLGFVMCQFSESEFLIGCGYDKHGLKVCHPSDKSYGIWGKKIVPWSQMATEIIVCWGVF